MKPGMKMQFSTCMFGVYTVTFKSKRAGDIDNRDALLTILMIFRLPNIIKHYQI